MSVTLTTLSSDNFQRANAFPLGGLWTLDVAGDIGLEVVNDGANAPVVESSPSPEAQEGYQYYNFSLPADCFASATATGNMNSGDTNQQIIIRVRATDIGGTAGNGPGYRLSISASGSWVLWQDTGTPIASGGTTLHAGDVFTIACIGTTVYALQNSTILGSVTNTSYSSGSAAMYILNEKAYFEQYGGAPLVSLFAVGSAAASGGGGSDTYNPAIPYLGTVTVVASAPAGLKNPFVGKMLVLSSAPASPAGPYLGHVVEGSAPSSGPDNLLGQVVVVAVAPAGAPDPFLGTVDKE
jgi:hypothetical protein